MTQISKAQIEQVLEHIRGQEYLNGIDTMLQGLLEQEEAQPVAWMISFKNSNGDPVRCVSLHNSIGDYRMFDSNATSEPLFTHPPAPKLVTADDITDEMLIAYIDNTPPSASPLRRDIATVLGGYYVLEASK